MIKILYRTNTPANTRGPQDFEALSNTEVGTKKRMILAGGDGTKMKKPA
jgi:hypothetical protein